MTESIKFGPEWLRNSVANVSSSNNNPSLLASPSSDNITCRPVLSDHRYGREEMLSLCDKSSRLPDVLTRFRRLYVVDWQTPLALQPNMDDERSGLSSGSTWGPSHIRPLMPGMGRGAAGNIRGGSIERGRGRGRGLYHGSAGYARSTSLYDEEGRRTNLWLDRNGVGSGGDTTEYGTSVSPRKEFNSRGMENWRKGTRDENGPTTGNANAEVDWRSSSNGTREKWARSTSWRDGESADTQQQQQQQQPSGSPPNINQSKPPVSYKKSWGEEDHSLPEWATESFDYGGTFDSSGAFHDISKDEVKKEVEQKNHSTIDEDSETSPEVPPEPQKFVDYNGGTAIDRMKEVADLVANLIMEDEPKDVKAVPLATSSSLTDWFYLDPQGDTQGPFTAQDMSEWYKAGYFQESLMVRRSNDGAFIPLGQLVKVYGRTAPFMQPQMAEAPSSSAFIFEKPQTFVEKPQVLFQPQPQHNNNNWNMMTPEQQILFLNMRLAHQRPPGPPQPVDYRIGNSNDFYQAPPVAPQQEIDPIQQLLMQLQKTGGQENQQQQQWMKPAAVPEVLNHNPSSIPVNNWNQQQHQQAPPINMWDNIDQTSQSLQIEPQEKKEINAPLPENEKEKVNGVIDQQHHLQHQFQAAPSSKGNKKKQREAQIKEANAPLPKQNQQPQQVKKKPNDKPREKKEERTTQPAAPAPWVGHQTQASGANLAKIQKTETQRRQEIQREREIVKNIDPKPDKKDVLNWVSAPSARVKTLDEIQAEEQVQSTAANAKREAAKKEAAAVVSSEAIIWNATPHSMAWQQPKVWSGEQTSGSGFWEEPTKPTSTVGPTKMLSKSQTMVSIATNKKPSVLQPSVKKQVPSSKKTAFVGEKKEKKDENNNEFTFWCTRTLGQMNGNVDVPTFVSFLQDIESPFEVKDYIKMYLGETKDCAEFAKQFLERRSKQRNQQRLQNAHIDDMCSPAPAITPSVGGISAEFQEVKGKNKKIKVKKVMKVIDGRSLLGFTATSASDRINVGDRDYAD